MNIVNELRATARTLRTPTGCLLPTKDKVIAALMVDAADAIARERRTPLPATTVTQLLPIMQDGWSLEDYGTWAIRAAERAHGICDGERTEEPGTVALDLTPQSRTEATALAKLALAYLGIVDAHLDAAIARCAAAADMEASA